MPWIKKGLCFLSFCVLPFSLLIAQQTVQGTVRDAETGETMPGVNVYLSNTTIGASTNEEGVYLITTRQTGVFNLVFSFIGYKQKISQITLKESSSLTKNMELVPHTFNLGEIEVTASNKKWKENFEKFRKQFIGTTKNARQTKIMNPWVIGFDSKSKDGGFIATASKPLVIKNDALGYTLTIDLDNFNWASYSGFFIGYPKFEEIETSDGKQKEVWRKRRQKTYENSFRYFLVSLFHNQLKNNHFKLSKKYAIFPLSDPEKKYELISIPGSAAYQADDLRGFKLSDKMYISHGDVNSQRTSKFSSSRKKVIRSSIMAGKRNELFFIDAYGNLLDPRSINITGDWAKQRVADWLPLDYISQHNNDEFDE